MGQFQNVFYYLEECGLLNPEIENDLYALHYVYIPRVNRALEEFRQQHNSHPLRTEENLIPTQLFRLSPRERSTDVDAGYGRLFGVEEEGPVPDTDSDNCIEVTPIEVNLTPFQARALTQIDPLQNDEIMEFTFSAMSAQLFKTYFHTCSGHYHGVALPG